MPSTREIVDVLKFNAKDWNRTGDKSLLQILNEAHRILLSQEMSQRISYMTDGDLPNVATTSGTYDYTLNQATTGLSEDIWRVGSVLVKPPFSNQLLTAIRVEYSITPNLRQPVQPWEWNGVEYFKFFQVHCNDALVSGHPSLKFTIDPGTTTTDYYLLAYKKPTEILAETTETEIPEHLHHTILIPAALKLLEAYQTGNWMEYGALMNEEFKPKFQAEMNEGEQGESHSVIRYEE